MFALGIMSTRPLSAKAHESSHREYEIFLLDNFVFVVSKFNCRLKIVI